MTLKGSTKSFQRSTLFGTWWSQCWLLETWITTHMTKQKYNSQKLRYFSRSSKAEKTKDESLIEETVLEWYDAKHRAEAKCEIDFINEISVSCCPYCSSSSIVKNGFNNEKVQRYKCKNCSRRFNPLTETIFDSKKIPISEWIEFLIHLFQFHSIKSTAFDNRNAISTTQYRQKKVFSVLEGIQDNVILSGTVCMDETFVSIRKKDRILISNNKEPGGTVNKKCIFTAVCPTGSICINTNRSHSSRRLVREIYLPHISKNSFLIHDEDPSHSVIIDELKLVHEAYKSYEIKKLKDNENPLTPINNYHSLLKKFLKAHSGFKIENLQDWLNLFWFISNTPDNKYDKVLSFIKLAVSKKKVVRFRCKTPIK